MNNSNQKLPENGEKNKLKQYNGKKFDDNKTKKMGKSNNLKKNKSKRDSKGPEELSIPKDSIKK